MTTSEEMQLIRIDQEPISREWGMTPIYKENLVGNVTVWQVAFDGESLRMSFGTVGGAVQTDVTKVELNSSGRTLQEQALLEARNRYRLKYREGYRPAGAPPPEEREPMLAAPWGKGHPIRSWPVGDQPKLDGIRLLASRMEGRNEGLRLRSRRNRAFPHLTILESRLVGFFEYLPAGAELDGELYVHGWTMNRLSSVVRSEKTRHPDLGKVEYHIFDIIYEDPDYPNAMPPTEARYSLLVNAYKRYLEDGGLNIGWHILSLNISSSEEELLEHHRQYVALGYEGTIIRFLFNGNLANLRYAVYKSGSRTNMLKHKDFIDEEGVILGVEEGRGTEAGLALFRIRDRRGNEFVLRMRGSFEQRRDWFERPEQVLGREITFRYQELSEYGVPRFPIGIAIRDYE